MIVTMITMIERITGSLNSSSFSGLGSLIPILISVSVGSASMSMLCFLLYSSISLASQRPLGWPASPWIPLSRSSRPAGA